MKQHGIIAVIFIIGCATGGVASQLVIPPVRAGTNPTRWEYLCGESTSNLNGHLVKPGTEGWELVSVFLSDQKRYADGTTADTMAYCFKRPLP
jgi:hypothetical protein